MVGYMKNIDNKRLTLSLLVIGLFLTFFGGSLAYFSWITSEEQNTEVAVTVTRDFMCTIDGGGSIESSDYQLVPTGCTDPNYAIQREVIVKPTLYKQSGSVLLDMWIDVKKLSSGLSNSENFKYALTTSSTSCTEGVVESGTFNGLSANGQTANILSNSYFSTAEDKYYLYIWLDSAETSSETMNQEFSLSLNGICTNDPITSEGNRYKINYNANGGNGTTNETVCIYGRSCTLATNQFTKTGYTFLGWSDTETGTEVVFEDGYTIPVYEVESDITLYALWGIDTYTIGFDVGSGTGEPESQIKTYGETLTISETIPKKDGHYFIEWNTQSDGSGERYLPGDSFSVSESVTLYAIWGVGNLVAIPTNSLCVSRTYTGSVQTLTSVTSGTGYTLSGYSQTEVGTHTITATLTNGYIWDDNTMENKTFTCSIEKATPTIILNETSGSVVVGNSMTFTVSSNVAGDFTIISNSSSVASVNPTSIDNVSANTTKTITVTGVSDGSSMITIGFIPDDTTNYDNEATETYTATILKSVLIPGVEYCSNPTYTGSEQLITNKSGETGFTLSGINKKDAGTYTVTATLNDGYRWSDNTTNDKTFTCSILKASNPTSVSAKGGAYSGTALALVTTSNAQGTIYYSTSTSLTSGNYSSSGSTTIPTGTCNSTSGSTYTVYWYTPGNTNYNEKSGSVENISVTCQTYTINYNANGGSGVPESQTKYYGITLTLSNIVPTRSGHTFLGWSTNSSDTSATYSSGANYTANAGATLYAIWRNNQSTVTYNSGNLIYDLNDVSTTTSNKMQYSVSNGVVTVKALDNDGHGYINARVDLEANRTYTFSCTSNGTWGSGVEVFLMLDGIVETYYRMASSTVTFTPTVSGTYWLRLDVNQKGLTYNFSNLNISYNIGSGTVYYGSTYGTLPTPTRSGYAFAGWNTASNGTGTTITSSTVVSTFNNHTLYAMWDKDPNTAYAVYSASDNSLSFYKTTNTITAGSTYNGKTVTAVYTGFETNSYTDYIYVPWYEYRTSISRVEVVDKFSPLSTAYWFAFVDSNIYDLTLLDTSRVTDMSFMFYQSGQGTGGTYQIIGMDNWNTSSVYNMRWMFSATGYGAITWSIGDISKWDTSRVTNMYAMFSGAKGEGTGIWSVGDISKWNTSNVTNMSYMFSNAGTNSSYSLDLSGWNVSKVTEHVDFKMYVESKIITPWD